MSTGVEKISRRNFNSLALRFIAGGVATAAIGCGDKKSALETQVLPTQEPLSKWSTVNVAQNSPLYVPAKGLDQSGLHIKDLLVYSNQTEPFLWFSVVLEHQNPRIYQVEFYLTKYKQNFSIDSAADLLGRPPVEVIPDSSPPDAAGRMLQILPGDHIDVVTPITKPSDKSDYVFLYKDKDPTSTLNGYIPLKFTFEISKREIA